MNIPPPGTAEGTGIQIGVIDARPQLSPGLMGAQFNDGMSSVGTYRRPITPAAAAPASCRPRWPHRRRSRNAQNATTGVAYKSSLRFIRSRDVVLDASAVSVRSTLIRMGDIPLASASSACRSVRPSAAVSFQEDGV